ncbi:DNA-3-methyladenine glycosylase II [Loktanella ponticola]|uniref:DNA-3-methyladenine glycosylase II n=1 Tax=Yoonia ponticola TaxID=1524255 RepID=A0A7W9BJY9_9RHOB|nr:DNA-3-methyladenine glycosylase 2 family protein [Yoonia ponticola]MBB5721637.1 DNA-3-methyladenine glycosylase II [Yoonia ponticola]
MIITCDADVAAGLGALCKIEPRFADVAEMLSPLPLRLRPEGFGQVMSAILGQQVSVASANATWARMVEAGMDQPENVVTATPDDLRALGLSRQKALYAHELAKAQIDYAGLRDLPDAEVIKTLTAVKGIGLWTAEIYAKFSLGRPDIFAAGDLALQIAAQDLFALPERPKEKDLRKMAAAWTPWRSVAARLLWAYYADIKQRDGIR